MSINGKVDFTDGKTTIITLKGGSGAAEGASPVHLDVSQK